MWLSTLICLQTGWLSKRTSVTEIPFAIITFYSILLCSFIWFVRAIDFYWISRTSKFLFKKIHSIGSAFLFSPSQLKLEGCTGKLEFSKFGKRTEKFLQVMTLQGYLTGAVSQILFFFVVVVCPGCVYLLSGKCRWWTISAYIHSVVWVLWCVIIIMPAKTWRINVLQ